jgi:hypothetical protein
VLVEKGKAKGFIANPFCKPIFKFPGSSKFIPEDGGSPRILPFTKNILPRKFPAN